MKRAAGNNRLQYYVGLGIVLFVLSLVFASKSTAKNDSFSTMSGVSFLLAIVILLVCIVIKIVTHSKASKSNLSINNENIKTQYQPKLAELSREKRNSSKLVIFLVVGATLIILIALAASWKKISDIITIHSANPAMVKLAQQAGMSERGEVVFLKTHPVLVSDTQMESDCSSNAAANNSDGFIEQGCYNPSANRIYIRQMPSNLYNLEISTAAYEMLHPVYISITNSGHTATLNSAIEADFQAINDTFLNAQVTNFAKTEPTARDLELFSLLGTGYSNLTDALTNYYQPYFSDISKTVAANNDVTQLFQNDQSQLTQLNSTITTDNNYATTAYNNSVTAYNNANTAYSDSVSWANIGNASEDTYNYNIYVQDFNIAKQDLNVANQDIDDENKTINQYNQILQSYQELVSEYDGTQPVNQLPTVQTHQAQAAIQ